MPVKSQQAVERPARDRPWRIETFGIEAVPDAERHGHPFELFWVWCGANISILGVVYGGILLAFGLDLGQALLVAALGALSFAVVGALSIAGVRSGVPTLTLSRAAFGLRGNLLPALISWIDLLGWETVNLLLATYALVALGTNVLHLRASVPLTLAALACAAVGTFACSLLGHATIVRIQQGCTWLFGVLTLGVALLLLTRTDPQALLHRPAGSWTHGVLPALSLVIAGTALGWTNTAADYTRYLPRQTRARPIVLWTTLGAFVPLFGLIVVGLLVSAASPAFATAQDPLAALANILPTWVAAPYFFTAAGGLVAGNVLASYSSGLNLLAMQVRVQRYKTILIDALVSIAGALYVIYVAPDFLGAFTSFLLVLAAGLAPWTAIFLVDMALRHARYDTPALYAVVTGTYHYVAGVNPVALSAWLAGVALSVLCTRSALVTGPWATGIFQDSALGFLAGAALAALLYALGWQLIHHAPAAPVTAEAVEPRGGRMRESR